MRQVDAKYFGSTAREDINEMMYAISCHDNETFQSKKEEFIGWLKQLTIAPRQKRTNEQTILHIVSEINELVYLNDEDEEVTSSTYEELKVDFDAINPKRIEKDMWEEFTEIWDTFHRYAVEPSRGWGDDAGDLQSATDEFKEKWDN